MIPKVIYYVWVGGSEKPEIFHKCLESWKTHLPNYDIVEINESNFDMNYHLLNNKFFRTCYDRKMWAFVSDYMRVVHLFENGGIYLDTDMEILKDFSILINSEIEFLAGFEDEYMVSAGIIGAAKGSETLKQVIDFYNNDIWNSELFTIPQILTFVLSRQLNLKDKLKYSFISDSLKLFPSKYFYPYHFTEKYSNECITENTYGIHWWGHSWDKRDDYVFLKTKHMSPRKMKVAGFLYKSKYNINVVRKIIRNKFL